MATSLALQNRPDAAQLPCKDVILALALRCLEIAIDLLVSGDTGFLDRYRARDALLGRPVRVDLGDRIVSGIGAGIDEHGRLLLRTPDGIVPIAGGRVLRDS